MRWDEVEQFLLDEAAADLAACGEVRPCLVSFRGDEPLFVDFLRSGPLADALLEVLALASPLRADRLALSLSGRAWSLADPVPPFLEGVGDLRQRVATVVLATAGAPPTALVVAHDGDWGQRVRVEPEGWCAQVLRLATETHVTAGRAAIRAQAARCVRLGHLVGVSAQLDAWLDGRCRSAPPRRRTSPA